MGIIATTTLGFCRKQIPIRRCSPARADIIAKASIEIHFYKPSVSSAVQLMYDKQTKLNTKDETWKLDLLWKVVWPLRSPRPEWSGMMQFVTEGDHPGKSSVSFPPMIDMDLNDYSCVYSTLKFVCSEARWQNITAVLTFDQPLWWKAQVIVANELSNSDKFYCTASRRIPHRNELHLVHRPCNVRKWTSRGTRGYIFIKYSSTYMYAKWNGMSTSSSSTHACRFRFERDACKQGFPHRRHHTTGCITGWAFNTNWWTLSTTFRHISFWYRRYLW